MANKLVFMPRLSDKRERLISAADALIHRQGFYRTTLAHIAEEAKVPLGNVYYYFKTKEDICKAVVTERKQSLSHTLKSCCRRNEPKDALMNLLKVMIGHSRELAEAGCPLSGLCQELSEECTELMDSADSCMKYLMDWSTEQFRLMGLKRAEELGFEFVSRVQGIILLGNILNDPGQLKRQLKAVAGWIEEQVPTSLTQERAAA
ncbi:MAG: TetR/AcrR family transcriptional regulator [Gammaproteobacteria bacterium]|nr:TetR/AcrR family transcriptional regulator [Gammaproteobacteria bacterium]